MVRCFRGLNGITVNWVSIHTEVEKTRTLGGFEEVVCERKSDEAGEGQDEEREELTLS